MLSETNYKALVSFRSGPQKNKSQPKPIIEYLVKSGYIEASSHESFERPGEFFINPTEYRLTPAGDDALSEYEQVVREKAKAVSDKKKDRAFDIFLVILAYVLGLLTPYIAALFK